MACADLQTLLLINRLKLKLKLKLKKNSNFT